MYYIAHIIYSFYLFIVRKSGIQSLGNTAEINFPQSLVDKPRTFNIVEVWCRGLTKGVRPMSLRKVRQGL